MTYQEKEEITNKAQIWADGACWQESGGGVGGWGALINENGEERTIYGGDSSTTNNKMEMLACIKALKDLKEASIVTIFTDSKYLINGITMWILGWKKNNWITKTNQPVKNRELWQELDYLCNIHNVKWKWVRGHSGNRGNEIADSLAVKGKEEEKERLKKLISEKLNAEL
jgi:ribonuclease HI